jgi:hypothetical protein
MMLSQVILRAFDQIRLPVSSNNLCGQRRQ